nr:nucleotidyltransferase domain-containing protein [Clostridium sp. SM-530-WT-3G]
MNTLKRNKKVFAIFVFGSIVNGDIWEGSDIDAFVVYEDEFDEVRHIYSEILDIPVHLKVLSKEKFLESYETNSKKGLIRDMLISSKLIYSKDEEIERVFDEAKYSMNNYIELWNLQYLGNLIKSIKVTKKYLYNDRIFTAYEVLIRALDNFAKFYLNLNSYIVSKDAVKMAMNLNNDFNNVVESLFQNGCHYEEIKNTVDYIEKYIDENISVGAKLLLNYLNEKNTFLSSHEIKNGEIFNEFNIKIEDILKELYSHQLIKKDIRKIDLPLKENIISENVYSR